MKWLMVLMVVCAGCMPVGGGGGGADLVEGVDVYPDSAPCAGFSDWRHLEGTLDLSAAYSCSRQQWETLASVEVLDRCGLARGVDPGPMGYSVRAESWESRVERVGGEVEVCLGGPQPLCTACRDGERSTTEWFGWAIVDVPLGGSKIAFGQGEGWRQSKATFVATWIPEGQ